MNPFCLTAVLALLVFQVDGVSAESLHRREIRTPTNRLVGRGVTSKLQSTSDTSSIDTSAKARLDVKAVEEEPSPLSPQKVSRKDPRLASHGQARMTRERTALER